MTSDAFETASRREYSAMVWCEDLSGNFYSSTALDVVAADNEDVVKSVTFVFSADDVITEEVS
jgi:hypothetical protein